VRIVKWVLPLILLTGVAIANFSSLPARTEDATTTNPKNQQSSWDDILILLARDEPPLNGRGPVCQISPGKLGPAKSAIWHQQPMFIWRQGDKQQIQRLEVRAADGKTVIWNQILTRINGKIVYAGQPLQAGQTYSWILFDAENKFLMDTNFTLMVDAERDRITTKLAKIENQLKKTSATAEEIAFQKVKFLANEKLWSDALQLAFAVQKPSEQLNQFIKDTQDYLCGS